MAKLISPYNPVTKTFMKTVNLTIGERVKAIEFLNAGKFNNSTLASVLDDIKKFVVTDEEWTAANLVKTPVADRPGTETWKWDETAVKDVELDQSTVDALAQIIDEKSNSKELGLSDGAVLTLLKKLK